MSHTTMWVDDGIAGVRCHGRPTDMVLDAELNDGRKCEECGAVLKLHYQVWIEEVGPIEPPKSQE